MRLTRALLLLFLAGSAQADDRAVAREHYIKGTKLFELGHYDDAIKEYDLAYQAKDDPVLLYNIAQAHRLAGHTKEAVFYYRAFNRKAPGNPHAAEVQTKIDELQKLLNQQSRADNLNPNDPIPPKTVVATEPKPKPAPPPVEAKPAPPVEAKPAPPVEAKPARPEPKPAKPTVIATAPPPNRPLFDNGQEIPPPSTPPPAETAPPPPANPPPVVVVAPAKPEVTKAAPPKDKTPIYKKWWLWTAVGGAAAVIIVVGAVVGTPTNTTIVSDCRFGVGNMGCAR